MSKKIIFVGPPNAGKTTLRKIFFEGENRSKLLEFGLEPTHGQESIFLRLSEDIGIFDLAGQENVRWLETEEKSIFYETKILIVVIDITSPIEDILNFAEKIIEIRNDLTPSSFIYLLLHKKDLITRDKLTDIKIKITNWLRRESSIKIAFTSIKKSFFLETLSLFMDILKTCTSKLVDIEIIDLNLLKNTIDLLYYIRQEIVISKTDLLKKLRITDEILNHIIEILENKNYIKISKAQELPLFSLTDKGKKYFEIILNNFSLEGFKFETNYYETVLEKKEIPPFLGFMIADKDGKTLMTTEVYDGIFDKFFKSEDQEIQTDYELIPMFISALEKFSSEINIQNLSGFKLKGTNIKMLTYRYDLVTTTFFMNANTNVKSVKEEINDWFENLLNKNEKEFERSIYSGDISWLVQISNEGRKWLDELNQKYKKMAINLDIFDFRQATDLYEKLENISANINVKYSIFIQKTKNLKNNLLKAVYEEKFQDIRSIAKNIRDLKV
jgi:GTPase SAR1 family protein